MEHYDQEKAARVWQRVQGQARQEPDPSALRQLLAAENEAAALFMSLARQTEKGPLFRRLAAQCRRHMAWLQGICRLTDCSIPLASPLPESREPVAVLLRKCYGSCLRTAAACQHRQEDPEYGHTYAAIARNKQEHCRILLALLGGGSNPAETPKKKPDPRLYRR